MEYWAAQPEMKDLRICFLLGCPSAAVGRIPLWEGFLGGHCHPLTKGGSGSTLPHSNLEFEACFENTLSYISLSWFWGDWKLCFSWIFMKFGDEFRFLGASFQGSSLVFYESEWVGSWLAVEGLGSHGAFQVTDSPTCPRDAFMWFPREIVTPYNIFTREPVPKCLVAKFHSFSLQTHLSS